tara:strand:- start:14455 stop:15342 length:888 start_codon:yes stop_codon:yes gene_type:complete
MPRIKNIDRDFVIHDNDKVVGSDAINNGATRNYTIGSIAAHFVATNATGSSTSLAWLLRDTADEKGEFHMSDNASWSNTVTITVSEYVHNNITDDHTNAIQLLKNRDIVIVEAGDKNVYAVYDCQVLTDNTPAAGFLTMNLVLKQSAGAPTEGLVYIFDSMPTDKTFTDTVTIQKDLKRTITTVVGSGTTPKNHECDLNKNDNFLINAHNGTNSIDIKVNSNSDVGQTGNILIQNPSSVGSLAFNALPSYIKTPFGATVNFDLTANRIAVISFIVLEYDAGGNHKVLINYIGDFS